MKEKRFIVTSPANAEREVARLRAEGFETICDRTQRGEVLVVGKRERRARQTVSQGGGGRA